MAEAAPKRIPDKSGGQVVTLEHAQHACLTYPEQSTTPASKSANVKTVPYLELPPQSKRTERNKSSIFLQRRFGTSQLTWSVVTKRCRSQGPVAIRWCVATDGWQGKSRKHVSLYSQRILLPLERSGVSILQQLNLSFIPRVACSKHH